jgi:IS30 family transposase
MEANPSLAADIARLKASGHSVRQIAKLLDKLPTTIQKYAA